LQAVEIVQKDFRSAEANGGHFVARSLSGGFFKDMVYIYLFIYFKMTVDICYRPPRINSFMPHPLRYSI